MSVAVLGPNYEYNEYFIAEGHAIYAIRNSTEYVPLVDVIVLLYNLCQAESGDCYDSLVALKFSESFGLISLAANPNCTLSLYTPVSSVRAPYFVLCTHHFLRLVRYFDRMFQNLGKYSLEKQRHVDIKQVHTFPNFK